MHTTCQKKKKKKKKKKNWELKVINSKVANFQKFLSNEDYYTQPQTSTYDQYNQAPAAPDLINQNNFPFSVNKLT